MVHVLILILWIVGLLDTAITAILLHSDTINEWNPVILWFLNRGGIPAMVFFKILYHTLLMIFFLFIFSQNAVPQKRAVVYLSVALMIYLMIAVSTYTLVFLYTIEPFP